MTFRPDPALLEIDSEITVSAELARRLGKRWPQEPTALLMAIRERRPLRHAHPDPLPLERLHRQIDRLPDLLDRLRCRAALLRP